MWWLSVGRVFRVWDRKKLLVAPAFAGGPTPKDGDVTR